MDNRYTASNVLENFGKVIQKEQKEKIQSVVDDYIDYNGQDTDWALVHRGVEFYLCEEVINKELKHVAQMVLIVWKGEKFKAKLKLLKQLGYTAKYVKQL